MDIFTGRVYRGNRTLWFHRPLDKYPVLAPAGAIIPLDALPVLRNGCPVHTAMELVVIVGKDGNSELYESEGSISSNTIITFTQQTGVLAIKPTAKNTSVPSQPRHWTVHLLSCAPSSSISVSIDGGLNTSAVHIHTSPVSGFKPDLGTTAGEITVDTGENPQLEMHSPLTGCREILHRARVDYDLKQQIWQLLTENEGGGGILTIGHLHAVEMEEALLGTLMEVLTASL